MTISRKLINLIFVSLLISSLCVSAPPAHAAAFPQTAEEITPLAAGDRAPSFTVQTTDNKPFSFDSASLKKPVVLIAFRGGWCPYCNLHLSELRTVIPKIRAMGFDVLFISNDRPELLYSSLKRETKESIEGLDYTILSDADLHAATAFGTAFMAADKLVAWLNSEHKDYSGSSIADHGALAVPSVYVIDTSGMIVFDYVNPNYKVRLSAEDVLAAASEAVSH